MDSMKISKLTGKAITLRGNEIDTDRIIPARFLRCVVFDGLEKNVFLDDRKQLKAQGKIHPFDQEEFKEASILLVNKNFGCGSSREHAPQAIKRWGINVIIGESYSEIFFGNNTSLGVPCLTVTEDMISLLMNYNEANPQAKFTVDLLDKKVYNNEISVPFTLPDAIAQQFIKGTWDATAELLKAHDKVNKVAQKLPYFSTT